MARLRNASQVVKNNPRPSGRARAEGEEMSVTGLQELEEMAVKLEANARKLPQSPNRDDLLRDIARFRAQLVARLPSVGLRAKGK
jgi:hypothetical protein